MSAPERQITAIHEAGHCVVAERLGYRVKKAWVYADNHQNGRFLLTIPAFLRRCYRSLKNSEESAMLMMSGNDAQMMFYPDSKILPSDDNALKRLLSVRPNLNIDKAKQELKRILSDDKNLMAIKEIAQVIDNNGSITGQEVREILFK